MIKLNRETYRDKILACWLGKNIGGTMGGPFEGTHDILDIQGFSTPEGKPLPNDDLDLQLVWLRALEEIGPYDLDCKKLGECWLSYVSPHWNEYGLCKTNMQAGLLPPLAGDYKNPWKNSNGAWIRTEVWACLAPACPDIAVKYAYEDACVDHGAGEGTTAAIFVAAMEAAAFVENDIRKLIEIGLDKIPEDSRMARTVRLVLKCYDEGMTWKDTRNTVLKENMDIGDGWFEAPSNVGYAVIGLLYGEGDFKKTMITAINCGDDTDCTAATVGSVLGIMNGTAIIPEDWKAHIGDEIITISVSKGILYNVPETCTELTDRIIKMAPLMLGANRAQLQFTDGETEVPAEDLEAFRSGDFTRALCRRPANSFTTDFNYATCTLSFEREPDIRPGEELKLKLHFHNNDKPFGGIPYLLNLRWILPESWQVIGPKSLQLEHITIRGEGNAEAEYTLIAGEQVSAINRLILEVTAVGRPTAGLIPVVVMG